MKPIYAPYELLTRRPAFFVHVCECIVVSSGALRG